MEYWPYDTLPEEQKQGLYTNKEYSRLRDLKEILYILYIFSYGVVFGMICSGTVDDILIWELLILSWVLSIFDSIVDGTVRHERYVRLDY